MTSIRKTFLSRVASFALVMALCLSPMAVFAADPVYSSGTDASNPAKAALTKVFKMPADIATPAATFTFNFTAVDYIGAGSGSMAAIGSTTVEFAANEKPAGGTFEVGDVKAVVKEADIFKGLSTTNPWPSGEGIYIYTVEETASGITPQGRANEGTEYSRAQYELEFWVEKDTNGVLFVKFVCAKVVEGFIDEYYDEEDGGEKVDPTPGGKNEIPTITAIDNGFSGVIFTNKYWGSDGGGTDDPTKAAFEVKKIITGNGADLEAIFKFAVKVTQPSLINTPQEYIAYVQQLNGGTWENVGSQMIFTSGVEKTGIELTHNQRIAFIDLHVASNVEVWESAADGYKITYKRTFAGDGEFTAPAVNTAWGFPRTGTNPDVGPHIIASGNDNIALFTNVRTGAAPMGLSVDNLPYVFMIVFGIASLGGYVALRLRRSAGSQITA